MSVRDVIQAAAGSAGDSKTYIEDVFSTYLYTGNGSTQTINNGIDLAGKGGMVWIKPRTTTDFHRVIDTLGAGVGRNLVTNSTAANGGSIGDLGGMFATSPGFSLPTSGFINENGIAHTSWTFRKAPKFFDVVTYTGNGVAGRTISHSLGQTPGMIIVKGTSAANAWTVYHRSLNVTSGGSLYLNGTSAQDLDPTNWNSTNPTASVFTLGSGATNTNGVTYVAYLFAHDTSTDGLIQCGSYTGNGGAQQVTVGFEPQWILIKRSDGIADWLLFDVMRGLVNGSDSADLNPNTSAAEAVAFRIDPTATGFSFPTAGGGAINTSGGNYIYMAIRRGPMRTPTDGTKVFSALNRTGTGSAATISNPNSFAFDTLISATRSGAYQYKGFFDRLRGWSPVTSVSGTPVLTSTTTGSETDNTSYYSVALDSSTGFFVGTDPYRWVNGVDSAERYVYYMLKRAPGFFDVVCYTGTGVARTVNHNLGVAPELMIVKRRNSADSWYVYTATTGNAAYLTLDSTSASASIGAGAWNLTNPTSSVFSVGTFSGWNASGGTYVAYLFASCPGVSKVGSYTGNGSSQTINCGFTNGARFVLIKRTNAAGDWYVWDTARGIVAATDPHLSLNSTAAEVTTDDTIDPASTGFIVNQVAATNVNVSGASYIFLSIA